MQFSITVLAFYGLGYVHKLITLQYNSHWQRILKRLTSVSVSVSGSTFVRLWKINQHLTIVVEGTDKPSKLGWNLLCKVLEELSKRYTEIVRHWFTFWSLTYVLTDTDTDVDCFFSHTSQGFVHIALRPRKLSLCNFSGTFCFVTKDTANFFVFCLCLTRRDF